MDIIEKCRILALSALIAFVLILPTGVILAATPVNAPGDLTAVLVSDYEVELTWKDNSTNESGFHIETGTNADFNGSLTFTMPANTTSYNDKTVAPTGDTYYYRVTAFTDDGGESTPTNVASVTIAVPKVGIPKAPGKLTATITGQGQITVTWTDNSTDETGFQLERATDSNFSAELVSVALAANSTTYTDITVVAAQGYYYRIYANNALGVSTPSNTASATASASARVPSAPTNLAARPLDTNIVRITWSNAETDQTEFVVERAADTNFTAGLTRFTLPADVTAHMTSYLDTTVIANTTYYYHVFAVNSVGSSPASDVATATTPASINAPRNSAATDNPGAGKAGEQEGVTIGASVMPLLQKYGAIAIVLVVVGAVLIVIKRRQSGW